MPRIAANLAAGIRRRIELGAGPLNILICENLINANTYLEELLQKELTQQEAAWFRENIGLVETTIGRMIPVQTDQMKDGEPLRVCVERYGLSGDSPLAQRILEYFTLLVGGASLGSVRRLADRYHAQSLGEVI